MPPLDMAIMQRGAPVSPPPPGQVSGSTHQQWQRRGVLGAESDLPVSVSNYTETD